MCCARSSASKKARLDVPSSSDASSSPQFLSSLGRYIYTLPDNLYISLSVCFVTLGYQSIWPSGHFSVHLCLFTLHQSLSICFSIPLFVCPSISPSLCPSVSPSLCLSISLSTCLSISLCPSVSPSLSVCLSLHLSVHLSLHLSVHLSFHPSIFLSIPLSTFQCDCACIGVCMCVCINHACTCTLGDFHF